MARHNPKRNPYGVDGSGKPILETSLEIETVKFPKSVKEALDKIYRKRAAKRKARSQS